jgi:hypothetical protein
MHSNPLLDSLLWVHTVARQRQLHAMRLRDTSVSRSARLGSDACPSVYIPAMVLMTTSQVIRLSDAISNCNRGVDPPGELTDWTRKRVPDL